MSQYDFYGNNGGMGGGYMASPGASPGGAPRRQGAQHALRPVTIKQLLSATQAHADADFKIDEIELGQITVVGQVVSVKNQATNSTYTLEDGSGRFEARHWVDATANEEESAIKDNTYVRVMGTLKSFGGRTYVNATHVRPCKDPHEPYFHTLEAMAVTLYLTRGPPGSQAQPNGHAPQAVNGQTNGASAYTAQASTNGSNDQWAYLPALEKSIIQFILSQPTHTEGIHVGAIARAVGGDARAISAALDHLMDEGHVYTTSDEHHFDVSV